MILLDEGLDCLPTSKIAEDGIALLRDYCLMKKKPSFFGKHQAALKVSHEFAGLQKFLQDWSLSFD